MAGARTFVVRVLADSKEAIAGLKKVGSESKKLGDDLDKGLGASLKNLLPSFRTVATVGAAAFAGAATAGFKLTQTASNLQESMSKVDAVFGESSKAIQDFAKTTATSLGITRQEALEAAGTFGNLIQAFGLTRPEAAGMSEDLVKLAADLASFNNVPIQDVFTALRSGLSGETEPLKRFGVAINDVRLKQEALNMGIYDGKGALDITAKTQAAYALILNSLDPLLTNLAPYVIKLPQSIHTQVAQTAVQKLVPDLGFHLPHLDLGGVGIEGLFCIIAKAELLK